jgi:hypothetical protein
MFGFIPQPFSFFEQRFYNYNQFFYKRFSTLFQSKSLSYCYFVYTKAFVTGVLVFGLLGITNTSIAIANQNIILFNAFAFFIRKSKIRATNAKIQTTRLLEKLECFEIILFNILELCMKKARALNKMI